MNQQDKIKEELIRRQIEKICQKNPDSVPVYYILSSKTETKTPEDWPVIFFSKKMILREVVTKLKQKMKQYRQVYIFGKDKLQDLKQAEMSLKQKRKNRGKLDFVQNVQKLVNLDQTLLTTPLGQIHQRYKDNNKLLVVILSTEELQKKNKKKLDLKQVAFIVVCVILIIFYLYLTATDTPETGQKEFSGDANVIEL